MAINLDRILVNIIISIIVTSPSLWIAGRMLVGEKKAKFTDAIWIAALGAFVGYMVGIMFKGFMAGIVQFILWLYLVKTYFDTGWGVAFIVSILTVIVFVALTIVTGIIGFGLIRVF